MKKHINAKQRELDKREKNKQKGLQNNAVSKVSSTGEVVYLKINNILNTKEQDIRQSTQSSKTKAKSMGLKSTLVFDGKIAVTSFINIKSEEKQKSAHIEKITDFDGKVINENPRMFHTQINKKAIDINNGDIETEFLNPSFDDCGKDYIGIKGILEQTIFGKTFDNDNLHIQLAYNILDIKKILGTYINNIVYTFYNLAREDFDADRDIIGAPGKNKEHIVKIIRNISPYFAYFDGVFKTHKKRESETERNEIEQHNVDVIVTLSYLRQFCVHGDINGDRIKFLSESILYNAEKYFATYAPQTIDIVNDTYAKGINSINNDFIAHASNNLYVISGIYNEVSFAVLLKEYYEFVMRKENNNLGVNTKQIREILIHKYYPVFKGKTFDTYRNKMYTVLGFVLYKELKRNEVILTKMIESLRANRDGDEGKTSIYLKYAPEIKKLIDSNFSKAIELFDIESKNRFGNKINIDKSMIESYAISVSNTDFFVKTIFLLCKFLDGKEINELCCALINKFDNIHDLIQSAKQCDVNIEFLKEYDIFKISREISDQIRVVKSISKMKPELSNISEAVILDALSMLGSPITKYKLDENNKRVFDECNRPVYTDEYDQFQKEFFETEDVDEYGYVKFDKQGKAKINHRRRNFIINNVLQSKWFFYVAKYNNPASCRTLMKYKNLIAFALRDVPEKQIEKYFRSVTGRNDYVSIDEMRAVIVNRLQEFSISSILSETAEMTERENKMQIENSRKEQMKAIVKLYLTVIYLITKSLVKVNTRFSIAFSAYERDAFLMIDDKKFPSVKKEDSWKSGNYAVALTKYFLDKDKVCYDAFFKNLDNIKTIYDNKERALARRANDKLLKKTHYNLHSYIYVSKNFETICGDAKICCNFRNDVQHLQVVNNLTETYLKEIKCIDSYYSLYCYILQRLLLDANKNAKFNSVREGLIKFGTYSKNFMWQLNIPFAYNLPRYKNLSNEVIFYDKTNK